MRTGSRGLLDGTLTEATQRYREAIDQGLLKIMAKMRISVVSSYRGGLNFEAVGLSRAMCAEYFTGHHPADRQFARVPVDEPEDAVREP